MTNVKGFILDTIERAVKTAAQTLLAASGGASINIWNLDWRADIGLAAGAAMVSVLTSISSGAVTGTASVVPNESSPNDVHGNV